MPGPNKIAKALRGPEPKLVLHFAERVRRLGRVEAYKPDVRLYVKGVDGVAVDNIYVAGLDRFGNGRRGEHQQERECDYFPA